MQFVVWDFVFGDVFSDVVHRPVGEWVDFVCVVLSVLFDDCDFGSFHALVSAQSCDPCVGIVECIVKRLDFSDVATEFSVVDAFVEEV